MLLARKKEREEKASRVCFAVQALLAAFAVPAAFAVLAAFLQCLLLAAPSTAKAAVHKAAGTAAFAVLAALQCMLLFCSACCLQVLLAFALSHIPGAELEAC